MHASALAFSFSLFLFFFLFRNFCLHERTDGRYVFRGCNAWHWMRGASQRNARCMRIMFLSESRESGDTSRYEVESWRVIRSFVPSVCSWQSREFYANHVEIVAGIRTEDGGLICQLTRIIHAITNGHKHEIEWKIWRSSSTCELYKSKEKDCRCNLQTTQHSTSSVKC